MIEELKNLEAGQKVLFGGNQTVTVSAELADAFRPGDKVLVINDTGDLLHVPLQQWQLAAEAVAKAKEAFLQLGACSDDAITSFYDVFAKRLADDSFFSAISEANAKDVAQAEEKGRSTTRLVLSEQMRHDMIAGLQLWRDQPSRRDESVLTIEHEGWKVEQRRAGLGVVGFIFEGRPNVFADACGVLRSGNTVVFRIGSDAYLTAQAIVENALRPALVEAGLPEAAVTLLGSKERSAGWAMFSDQRLGLAVARGSGAAVSQLGAVARQAGVPCSLHGTGGAWLMVGQDADAAKLREIVAHSLDRKVCNTLNTICVPKSASLETISAVLDGVNDAASKRSSNAKFHVIEGSEQLLPTEWFDEKVEISRASGSVTERRVEVLKKDRIGTEWEWEASPEVTLVMVEDTVEAVLLFNTYSPRFVASLVSDDGAEQELFWKAVDAPFVGNGFTRWVDGQYAFNRPELGLSNWHYGRLFARGAVLSGDSVYTLRSRMSQNDPSVER